MRSFRAGWLIATWTAAFTVCGCSGDSSKPQIQPGADSSAKKSKDAGPITSLKPLSRGETSSKEMTTADEPSKPSSRDVVGADSAGDPVQQMLAEIRKRQSNQPQARSREDFFAQVKDNMDKVIELSAKVVAANPEPNDRDEARMAAMQAIAALTQVDRKGAGLLDKADKLAEEILADTPEGETAAQASFLRVVAHLVIEGEKGMDDPAVTTRLLGMAKEFAEKFPDYSRGNQLLYQISQNAQMAGQYDTAKEALQILVDREGESQMGKIITAKLRLLETIGNPPEITGPTLEGSDVDIASLKGKVVLVDFWATWCGPCVAELPNVKAVYEKYHDQGFEVLAVSFDQTKDVLVKFVDENKLPWPQIFFDEDGKRFWDNPIGQKYGIDGIPATFLIDREGNLQKIGVRGPMLEPAVVELLKVKSPEPN